MKPTLKQQIRRWAKRHPKTAAAPDVVSRWLALNGRTVAPRLATSLQLAGQRIDFELTDVGSAALTRNESRKENS